MQTKNRGLLVLGVVSVNLLLFELLSLIGVYTIGVVKPDRRLDLFVERQLTDINDEEIQKFLTGAYDKELGWDVLESSSRSATNVAGEQWTATYDNLGARRSCIESTPILISTYGDSFTHGDEVNDDETWQCDLERHFGQRVLNFGVGGYGVDQALLKMKRHWREGTVTPITILTVHTSDLKRVVNQYRPFVNNGTGGKLSFKPSYQYVNGEIRFLPNPLTPDVKTKREISELAISVAATDFWESRKIRIGSPAFPFSLQFLNVGYRIVAGRLWDSRQRTMNIWDEPEGAEIMLHLLHDFVDSAHDVDTLPVLVLLPSVSEWKAGRVEPQYRRFLTHELLRESLNMTTIDFSEANFKEEKFQVLPFRGHASSYGNSIIAKAIIDALEPVF